jgi:hypothetical protein
MKITAVAILAPAILATIMFPAAAFAASPDPEGAAGSTAGVYGGESSSTTAQESNRGTASSTDASHNTTTAQPQSNSSGTTGAGSGMDAKNDPAGDMSGSGGANTGLKTTTTPSNVGPPEPGDSTSGTPAR